jgi:phosphatidylglycerol:prolipoprotein diacylglycerol transferase
MYFPLDLTHQLRHPSQLYEAFFEGIFLFLIFWSIRKRKYFDGFFLSLYLIGYGLTRFFIEFVREPISSAAFRLGPFNLAQIFCIGMILAGIFTILIKKPAK